jgi:hypothetical protein
MKIRSEGSEYVFDFTSSLREGCVFGLIRVVPGKDEWLSSTCRVFGIENACLRCDREIDCKGG